MMKADEFVSRAVDIAEHYKTLYVMGCFGAPLTGANKGRYCNNHPFNPQPERTAMIRGASDDTFGFDCVNLIKGILWGWSGDKSKAYGGAGYAVNGVPDVNADTMITKCRGVSSAGWDQMAVGEALWCAGHIGIYIGKGLAVECTPAWENRVQITAVANIGKPGYPARVWKRHGRLPYLDYTEAAAGGDLKAVAVGCTVKIIGSRYATGQPIPAWVKSNTHVVSRLDGERALLGADGGICSWVNLCDLEVVG